MAPRKSASKQARKSSAVKKSSTKKASSSSLGSWRDKYLSLNAEVRDKVMFSVAASAKGVAVDSATLESSPANLLDLNFGDSAVGITTQAGMNKWKSNLANLMPGFASQIHDLPANPNMRIGDVAASLGALAAAHGTAPTVFAVGLIKEARKQIVDKYGIDFAGKATDMCLQYLSQTRRESVSVAVEPLILEFASNLSLVDLPHLANRRDRISARREKFYRYLTPLRMMLEKFAGGHSVEACWLNQSIRVSGGARPVAEIAADSQLQRIDLPRRLRREMNVSTNTIGATAFRNITGLTGQGVVVAVIDGEVDINHPAFAGRVILQKDFTDEGFGIPDSHGTAVAGILGAADPQFGGIAPAVQLFNYKIFGQGNIAGDDFDGALALTQALLDGCHIANCSWGNGPANDGTSREAIACDNAWSEGLVIVKSAGNEGPGHSTMTTPADASGIIVVAATDRNGTVVADYSSRGPSANNRRPHLAAPGGLSIDPIRATAVGGGFTQAGQGTSFAAPMVSGLAALLLEAEPNLTPDEVRARLVARCRPLPGNDPNVHGAGLIDFSTAS